MKAGESVWFLSRWDTNLAAEMKATVAGHAALPGRWGRVRPQPSLGGARSPAGSPASRFYSGHTGLRSRALGW